MNKKVSVIVPVYNAEKYLKRSIESVINQTYKDLEIIIIDDKSTDNSKKIIQKYASSDNRIRAFFSEINQGVSKSRNIGMKSVSGDYIIFMDADDYIVPNAIEVMMNASNKYNADIVDSYHLIIYTKNNKNYYFTENKVPKKDLILGSLDDNIEVLTKSTYITGKLISRKLIDGMSFDENLKRYEDLVFEHQLKLKLKNMVFVKEVLYYYYQVSDSLINTLGTKHEVYLEAAKNVIENYKNSNKEIKLRIESLLVTNAFLTGISKIVKNDNGLESNTNLLFDYLSKFDKIFPTWRTNKYINNLLRNYIIKLINNKKKVYKLIKKTRNIDFIKLYFKYLSIVNKYKK